MKTYAVYTKDYPRLTIKNHEVWMSMVTAMAVGLVALFVFSTNIFSVDPEPVFEPKVTLLVSCMLASLCFCACYCGTQSDGYYLASIPIKGIGRALFFIFAWTLWIPLLISFMRMKLGEREKARMDIITKHVLEVEARHYATTKPTERFPESAKRMLETYCHLQASKSKLEMTDEEAAMIVEKTLKNGHVLEVQIRSTVNICIIFKARLMQLDTRYDLGNYCLELLPNDQYKFYQERSGRLANELTIENSADNELLSYFNECKINIQRHLYTGRLDLVVEEIARILDVNYCGYMYQPYRMGEHYHVAADYSSSILDKSPS